jgi:hypothetical protein
MKQSKSVKEYSIKIDPSLDKTAAGKREEDITRLCDVVFDPIKDQHLTISLGINIGRKVFDTRQSIFRVDAHGKCFYFVEALDSVRESLEICRDLPGIVASES